MGDHPYTVTFFNEIEMCPDGLCWGKFPGRKKSFPRPFLFYIEISLYIPEAEVTERNSLTLSNQTLESFLSDPNLTLVPLFHTKRGEVTLHVVRTLQTYKHTWVDKKYKILFITVNC